MQTPENRLIGILKQNKIDFVSTLPCEKIKDLLDQISRDFFHIPLTREEEGVGIAAGIALTGKRLAMFVQSSGIGNMINALLSLTGFYELPLAIFVCRRGVYKEKIAAQVPMGKRLPEILKGAGISFSTINTVGDISIIEKELPDVYNKNKIHAFLLSPAVFEGACDAVSLSPPTCPARGRYGEDFEIEQTPEFTRYEILKILAAHLDSKIVVCNLGIPSKELYDIKHQPSNFYMLGSMGMATPIGLGISLSTDKQVVVIDGDGSILMNPGSFATAAHFSPPNLTIIAVDNSSYGSTGSQPTLTGSCVDLALLAKGFGIGNVVRVASKQQLNDVLTKPEKALNQVGHRYLIGQVRLSKTHETPHKHQIL